MIRDKLSTAEVLHQGTKFVYARGANVGQMIVFMTRIGLIGKHLSSYDLFEYSLSITQNLDVFFSFSFHTVRV